MGADHDLRLAGLDNAQRRPPLAGRHRLHQRRHPHAERVAQRRDAKQVLRCQRLCGSHHRPLAVALDRSQQRVHGHQRLAAADVTLEQPLHRRASVEVAVDLSHRSQLGCGGGERQRLQKPLHQRPRPAQRPRNGRPLQLAAVADQPGLE